MSFLSKAKRAAEAAAHAANAALTAAERLGAAGGASRVVPVPQALINRAVRKVAAGIGGVQSAEVEVDEGTFVLHAVVKKLVTVEASVRFRFVHVDASATQQTLTLQQVGPTQLGATGMMSRLVVALVEGFFASVLQVDPVQFATEQEPHVVVDGDRYTVTLDALDTKNRVVVTPAVRAMLEHGRVTQIDCQPGRLLLTLTVSEEIGETATQIRGALRDAFAFAAQLTAPAPKDSMGAAPELPPAGGTDRSLPS